MYSSNAGSVERRGCNFSSGSSARWSGINIAGMVVGFVFFWPVGLLVLFWILSGRDVQELPATIKEKWSTMFGAGGGDVVNSDNVVFNDYQQTQYDRISEIKEEIKSRARRFSEFRMDVKRRADQEEFNKFMAGGSKPDFSDQKHG